MAVVTRRYAIPAPFLFPKRLYLVKCLCSKIAVSDPELSEVNSHARLNHSKQLLKKYSPNDVRNILFTDEKIFTTTTTKNPQNDPLYASVNHEKGVVTKRLQCSYC